MWEFASAVQSKEAAEGKDFLSRSILSTSDASELASLAFDASKGEPDEHPLCWFLFCIGDGIEDVSYLFC